MTAGEWARAFHTVRLHPGTKIPVKKGFQLPANRPSPMDADEWVYKFGNIGVIPRTGADGRYVVIDCDSDEAIQYFTTKYWTGPTLTAITPRGTGRHYWYRLPDGFASGVRQKLDRRVDIDVKYNGFVVVPPSEVVLKGAYRWVSRVAPAEIPPALLSAVTSTYGGGEVAEAGERQELLGWALDTMTQACIAELLATPQGNRNNRLYQAYLHGADTERVYRAIEAAGWPDLERCRQALRLNA